MPPLVCSLGDILSGTPGLSLWGSVQAFPPAGMFLCWGRDQDTQKAQPHLPQNRPQLIPCTHRPCWKGLRGIYFRDRTPKMISHMAIPVCSCPHCFAVPECSAQHTGCGTFSSPFNLRHYQNMFIFSDILSMLNERFSALKSL